MAKPKKQSKPVEQTPESTDRLSSLKQLAKQMSSHFNNQYKQAISYVPDSSMIASVTVSRWVEMPEAFQEAVELPGLPFGNITCIYGKPDTGKCHPKDTPILMYDGSIKMVQNMEVGDLVMGPDSLPRQVLSKGTGKETIYEVVPNYGDSWKCNESHILALTCNQDRKYGDFTFKKGEKYNISLKEYLTIPDHVKHSLKLYRAEVNFNTKEVPYDPYFIGLWLGDGSVDSPVIHQKDEELEFYFSKFATDNGLTYKKDIYRDVDGNEACPKHSFIVGKGKNNPLRDFVKSLYVENEKRIPKDYLINNSTNRLALLAGLIDSDGHNNGTGGYELCTKWDGLKSDILFLARSLGLRATSVLKFVDQKAYHRITITGFCDKIPVKLSRKVIHKKEGNFKNPLTTGFTLKKLEEDTYYGFELSGDHLYLLGDFTVTHNTTILMEGIKACQDQGILPILILTEHKFDFTRLPTFMGADPDAMLVLPAESLEQGYEFVEKILRDVKTGIITVEDEKGEELSIDISKHGCYIFWDSIGNTMSETELEYEVADHGKSMGKAAKAIKTLTRRVNQLLGKVRQQVGILFLNQSYQSMPSYGPSVETPYGGDGIPYSSALVLRTRRIRDIKMTTSGKESVVGLEMKLQVMKNHISHSKPTAEVFVLASGLATPSEQTLKEYKAFLKKLD